MSAHGPLDGAVPLDRSGQVAITDMRILPVAGVDVLAGGLNEPSADAHLRVVDIPNGIAWLIPLDTRALSKLAESVGRELAGSDG